MRRPHRQPAPTRGPAKTEIIYEPLTRGDQAHVHLYLRMYREEFSKYPPPFVKATGMKQVILVKKFGKEEEKRGAMPDYANHAIWASLNRPDFRYGGGGRTGRATSSA